LTRELFARAVTETDRLASLVDDLLDLGRIESGQVPMHLAPCDPTRLLTEAVERLRPQAERAGVALHLDADADLPPVLVDRARIGQVVLNLVHNAIKFTPAGGSIVVGATRSDSTLIVTVRDTGVGIADEHLDRLFERFYKADKGRHELGTGLGLAIAKHIVQSHGGTIHAQSTQGEGATFSFTLPIAHAAPATGPSAGAVPPADLPDSPPDSSYDLRRHRNGVDTS
jgi:two-component system phosphate regulon sensor histidine kinase PhoR